MQFGQVFVRQGALMTLRRVTGIKPYRLADRVSRKVRRLLGGTSGRLNNAFRAAALGCAGPLTLAPVPASATAKTRANRAISRG
jgi:hypothetical protein